MRRNTFVGLCFVLLSFSLSAFTCHGPTCAGKKCQPGWHCEMQGGWADPQPVCVVNDAIERGRGRKDK